MVENTGCGFNRLRPYTSPRNAGRSHQLSYKAISHLLSQASVFLVISITYANLITSIMIQTKEGVFHNTHLIEYNNNYNNINVKTKSCSARSLRDSASRP